MTDPKLTGDLGAFLALMENSCWYDHEAAAKILKNFVGPIEHTFAEYRAFNSMKNWIKYAIDSTQEEFFAMFGAADTPVMADEGICSSIVSKAEKGIQFIFVMDKWVEAENSHGFLKNEFLEIINRRDSFPLFQKLHFGIRRGYPSAPHVYAADNSIAVVESLHKFPEMPHHVNVYSAGSSPDIAGFIRRKKNYIGFKNIRMGGEISDYLMVKDLSQIDLGPEYNALLARQGHDLSLHDPAAWVKKAVTEELGKTVADLYNEEGALRDIDHPDVLKAMSEKAHEELKKWHEGHYIAWYRGMILNKAESADILMQTMPGHYRNYPYTTVNCDAPVDRTPLEFDGFDMHPA